MNPQQKVQLYSVEQAVEMGVNGIAVHVNVGSVHLHEQIEIMGRLLPNNPVLLNSRPDISHYYQIIVKNKRFIYN
ncbi:hypothetical protein GF351_03055 [Candidatus Woesearchaeota archaeon]|nr:hypothetical protein [Candidatus Woesearchaeota archaeon]